MRFVSILAVVLATWACSGTQINLNEGASAKAEKGTATTARGYAKETPPSGARSAGTKSAPKAGGTTIPIEGVEVFTFAASIDDDEEDEDLYWAYDDEDDVVYLWGTIDIDCIDEDGVETGETGTAELVLESDSEGWGWLIDTDACGYSTTYGCSDDGSGETCGGCDWDEDFIVCAEEDA